VCVRVVGPFFSGLFVVVVVVGYSFSLKKSRGIVCKEKKKGCSPALAKK
jgi:hypothetical protein